MRYIIFFINFILFSHLISETYIQLSNSDFLLSERVSLLMDNEPITNGENYFDCGDINGDGIDDIIIWRGSRINYPYSLEQPPYLSIYYGQNEMHYGRIDINESADVLLSLRGQFGEYSVSIKLCTVGDLNSDGYSDFLLPSSGLGGNPSKISIIYGNLLSEPIYGTHFSEFVEAQLYDSTFISAPKAVIVNLDGEKTKEIVGNTSSSFIRWGQELPPNGIIPLLPEEGLTIYYGINTTLELNLGDINGDGLVELGSIPGKTGWRISGHSSNFPFILFGNSSSPWHSCTLTVDEDIEPPPYKAVFQMDSNHPKYMWGGGDFNGDDYGDLVISRYSVMYNSEYGNTAEIYLILGYPGIEHLGTVDIMDVADGVSIRTGRYSTATGWTISGGDFNGDGYADIVVSAVTRPDSWPEPSKTVAFIALGNPEGYIPPNIEDWQIKIDIPDSLFPSWSIPPELLTRTSTEYESLMTYDVNLEGDYNADGLNDLVLTNWSADEYYWGLDEGDEFPIAYLFFNHRPQTILLDSSLTSLDQPIRIAISTRFAPIDPSTISITVGDTTYRWGDAEITLTDTILTILPSDGWESLSAEFTIEELADSIWTAIDEPIHFTLPTTGIAEMDILPEDIELTVYPNPFNSTVRISVNGDMDFLKGYDIEIYNLTGKLVKRLGLSDGKALWNGRDNRGNKLPSGMYFIKAEIGDKVITDKIILLQ